VRLLRRRPSPPEDRPSSRYRPTGSAQHYQPVERDGLPLGWVPCFRGRDTRT
jgi:hypothetical protein